MATKKETQERKEKFLQALRLNMNNVSKACKKFKMARKQYYRWLDSDSEFKQAVSEIEDSLIDMAESALYSRIKEGNVPSTIFYLKTKGKKRGYIEKTENETTIKGGGINIDIVLPPGDIE